MCDACKGNIQDCRKKEILSKGEWLQKNNQISYELSTPLLGGSIGEHVYRINK